MVFSVDDALVEEGSAFVELSVFPIRAVVVVFFTVRAAVA